MSDTLTVQLDGNVTDSIVQITKWLQAHEAQISEQSPVAGAYVKSAIVCLDDAHDLLFYRDGSDDSLMVDAAVERDRDRRHNRLCTDEEGHPMCFDPRHGGF